MKNRKGKLLALLLLILATIFCLAVAAACDGGNKNSLQPPKPSDDPDAPHQHSYVLTSQTDATCTADGSKVYSCGCGASYVETIDKLGHDLGFVSEEGGAEHWQKCSRCDYATDPVPHSYDILVQVEREPSCSQTGIRVVRCECGASVKEPIDKTQLSFTVANRDEDCHWTECSECHVVEENSRRPHAFDVQLSLTPSTCTERGSRTMSCECGATSTERLPLAEHNFGKYMYDETQHWRACVNCNAEQTDTRADHAMQRTSGSDPTCTADGREDRACVCGKTESDVTTPALGHSWDKSEFSKRTIDGHYYKCERCGEEQKVQHDYQPCECPDGFAKSPTCGAEGHADEMCTECRYLHEYKIPATGSHVWSESDLRHNGTTHWHYCIVCNLSQGDETPHDWQWITVEQATCQHAGKQTEQCVCGETRGNKTVPQTEHKYTEKLRQDSTCSQAGSVVWQCETCNDEKTEVLDKLPHNWSAYTFDSDGHKKSCLVCGTEDRGNHNLVNTDGKSATCTSDGFSQQTCTVCNYVQRTVLKQTPHSYVYVENSEVKSTCTVRGYYYNECSACGDRVKVDAELAPHTLDYFEAKERTETEDGWRNHWQCRVCGKYFSSKDCHEELTEEQVFDRNPKTIVAESLAQLIEFAQNFVNAPSKDYYQVQAVVYSADIVDGSLLLTDSDGSCAIFAYADPSELVDLSDGDVVTVKGFLQRESDQEAALYQTKVVSVQSSDPDLVSLRVFTTVKAGNPTLYAVSETAEYFSILNFGNEVQTLFVNKLSIGEELTFTFTDYGKNGVKSVIAYAVVNDKPVVFQNGVCTITVEGDVVAEFVFAQYAAQTVKLDQIDTAQNGVIQHSPYLSYQYVGTANNYVNRLYAGSHLRFTLTGAYITRVEIEFEDYNSDKLKQNTVGVGTDELHKAQTDNGYGNLKAVLTFDKANRYGFFEYNAISQTRVLSITIQYETYNN